MTLLDKIDHIEYTHDSVCSIDATTVKLDKIYFNGLMKKELLKYEDNSVLEKALKKEKTIEQSLKDVQKTYGGWKLYFPRLFKNKEHNKTVEELDDLIWRVDRAKTKNLFDPNNPIAAGAYGFAMGYVAAEVAKYDLFTEASPPAIAGGLLAFVATVWGIFAAQDRKLYEETFEDAKYLDSKIQELFQIEIAF